MGPRRKSVIEDELREFKLEVEQKWQQYMNQIKQEIKTIKEDCQEKIRTVENEYKEKLTEIEKNCASAQKYASNCVQQQNTFHTTEITKPVFFGNNKDMHPKDFINRLEEYFAIKQIYVGEKIIVVGDCLRSTAYNWFSTIRFQLSNYEEFKKAFIDEYWSREIQIQIWSQCLNTNQIPQQTNYREHFSAWVTKLRHLEVPRLSEQEIVKSIANHYPGYLRAILVSLPERTIMAAMKMLGEEEHRKPQWSGNNRTTNRNYREQNNNNEENRSNQNERVSQLATEEIRLPEEQDTTHVINNVPMNSQSASPYILCEVEGEKIELLIDTGATISVLTKEIVDAILAKNDKIPMLPVNGIQISNAIGRKICKVTRQIFCECKIGEVSIFASFVQVENLNEKGIIGADVLNQYHAQINFRTQTVLWKIQEREYTTMFVAKTKQSEGNSDEKQSIQMICEEEEEDQKNKVMLSPIEKEEFNDLLTKYKEVFSPNPGKISKYECQINITEGEPIYQKPYPIPMSKLDKMEREIQRMLDLEIIEKSTSPWSSPIIGIEKKDGSIRLCLDARKINQRIIPDRECPMNIDEILMKFQGAKYLSSIDLTAGYWQCPLAEKSRAITAFLYRGRNYQFRVLPFGLVNSIAEFQKILDKILGPEILQFTALYVDDIHIMSKNFQEHMQHLETIFKVFLEHNVKINVKKSQFLNTKTKFLGHIISEQGITMDPDKVLAVQKFQPPKNKKQIQAFLGFVNFYRRYIRDLSQLTSILSQLTKKNEPWKWGPIQQQAFEQIKEIFLEDIIVEYPDFEKEFYLATDASNTHIGAELYQIGEEGKHQTLGFTSRTLNATERRYFTTELEPLAIVFACKKFRGYILGHKTNILTDHQALTFLNTCRLLNARLTRWSIILQEYNLEIKHIPGKENIGPDTLTRYPQSPEDNERSNVINISINKLKIYNYSAELRNRLKNIKKLQDEDEKLNKIIQRVTQEKTKHFLLHNEILFTRDKKDQYRLMIPLSMAALLIKETHEIYGHMGAYKIYKLLHTNYQTPCMYRLVKKVIKTCNLCQRSKINNQLSRGPLISQIPVGPKQSVSVDLMGPLPRGQLGAQYILAILDIFSKHIKLYALRKATTATILKKIAEDYLPRFGPIKQILTDNGTQFQNHKWKSRLKELGIHVSYTTTYNPEGNPVERVNREIGRILRTYCHKKHTTWVQYMDNIEYWLNNSTHESTGYTPQQILTGKKAPLSIDKLIPFPNNTEKTDDKLIIQLAYNKLKETARLRNKSKDENKKFPQYVNGQKVLIREHKLSSAAEKQIYKLFLLYKGPYTINNVNSNNTVIVTDEHGQQSTHNLRNIKPYVPPDPGNYRSGHPFL